MKLNVMKKWIGFDGTPTTSIVYWAKYEHFTNPINEGYVGVTYKTLEERKRRHIIESKSGVKNYFKNVLKNNEHLVQWNILNSNITELMSKKIEFFLRSKENIGWNTVAGGGKPPKSKKGIKKNEELVFKRRLKVLDMSNVDFINYTNDIINNKTVDYISNKYNICHSTIVRYKKRLGLKCDRKKQGFEIWNKIDKKAFSDKQKEIWLKTERKSNSLKYPENYYLEIPFIKSNNEAALRFNINRKSAESIKRQFNLGKLNWLFEKHGIKL